MAAKAPTASSVASVLSGLSGDALNQLQHQYCLKKNAAILNDPSQWHMLPTLAFHQLPRLRRGLWGNMGRHFSNAVNPRPHAVLGGGPPITRGVFCFGIFEKPSDVFDITKYLTLETEDPDVKKQKKKENKKKGGQNKKNKGGGGIGEDPEYMPFPECAWIPSRDLISPKGCALEPYHRKYSLTFAIDNEHGHVKEKYAALLLKLGAVDPPTCSPEVAYDTSEETPLLFYIRVPGQPHPEPFLFLRNHLLEDDLDPIPDYFERCCDPECDGENLVFPPGLGPRFARQKNNRPRAPDGAFSVKFRMFEQLFDVRPVTRTCYSQPLIRCAQCRSVFACHRHVSYLLEQHQKFRIGFENAEHGDCLKYYFGSEKQYPTYPCYVMHNQASMQELELIRLVEREERVPIRRMWGRPWANPALWMFRIKEFEVVCESILNMSFEDVSDRRFREMHRLNIDYKRMQQSISLQQEIMATNQNIQDQSDMVMAVAKAGKNPSKEHIQSIVEKIKNARKDNSKITNLTELSMARDAKNKLSKLVADSISRVNPGMFGKMEDKYKDKKIVRGIMSTTHGASGTHHHHHHHGGSAAAAEDDEDETRLGPQARAHKEAMDALDDAFSVMAVTKDQEHMAPVATAAQKKGGRSKGKRSRG